MNGRRLGLIGGVVLLVGVILITGCSGYGMRSGKPSVVIVSESRSVRIIEPNETFTVVRRSAVLDVGWYMELVDLYMEVQAGKWEKVEP